MKITPIAFDSFGVRSEATFVETKDVKILIDGSAALGPLRYSLPPHPLELKQLDRLLKAIRKYAEKSDVIIVSHFHYDHYAPDEPELFENKIALIKHPKENINRSQYKRACEFIPKIEKIVKRLEFADNREFKFGETKVKFSPAVWHGNVGSKLGYVIMSSIDDGRQKFLHGSDAQGVIVDETANWMIRENPDIMVIDGPPLLFVGWRMGKKVIEKSIKNDIRILEETKVKTVIFDHHVVRDLKYKEKMKKLFDRAEELGKNIMTAAEFVGKKPNFLEARRKELYEKY